MYICFYIWYSNDIYIFKTLKILSGRIFIIWLIHSLYYKFSFPVVLMRFKHESRQGSFSRSKKRGKEKNVKAPF